MNIESALSQLSQLSQEVRNERAAGSITKTRPSPIPFKIRARSEEVREGINFVNATTFEDHDHYAKRAAILERLSPDMRSDR